MTASHDGGVPTGRGVSRAWIAALLGGAVGLLVGVVGSEVVRGRASAHEPPESPPGASDRHGEVSGPPPLDAGPSGAIECRRQLEQAERRIQQLTAELDQAKREPSAPPPPAVKQEEDVALAAAREHAARLGVSDGALAAVWRARDYFYADAEARERILVALRPLGEEAFRAAAALYRAGYGHVGIQMVLTDLGVPGGGDLLLRMIEDDSQDARWLLRALSGYDSPTVRDYLVQRIARETDPAAFWNLAAALGALKEPRGAEAIRLQVILGPEWAGVRGPILLDVGRMGGAAAIRLLENYLLLPSADAVGAALTALAGLDRPRARAHASRIKQSDRYGFLGIMDRPTVDQLAAER